MRNSTRDLFNRLSKREKQFVSSLISELYRDRNNVPKDDYRFIVKMLRKAHRTFEKLDLDY